MKELTFDEKMAAFERWCAARRKAEFTLQSVGNLAVQFVVAEEKSPEEAEIPLRVLRTVVKDYLEASKAEDASLEAWNKTQRGEA